MHRIDHPTAINERFTGGDPNTGQEATIVTADWTNDIQENLVRLMELAGHSFSKGVDTDLYNSILKIIELGGSQLSVSIANNTSDIDTGIIADSSLYRFMSLDYYVYRKTDSSQLIESGKILGAYDLNLSQWMNPVYESSFNDSGVTFSFLGDQLLVSTDDMTGASYEGLLVISNLKFIKN